MMAGKKNRAWNFLPAGVAIAAFNNVAIRKKFVFIKNRADGSLQVPVAFKIFVAEYARSIPLPYGLVGAGFQQLDNQCTLIEIVFYGIVPHIIFLRLNPVFDIRLHEALKLQIIIKYLVGYQ
jgi:hypothetical protein